MDQARIPPEVPPSAEQPPAPPSSDEKSSQGAAGEAPSAGPPEWRAIVARFETPSTWRALWQIADTFGLYALLWYVIYLALDISYWLVVPFAVLAGALLVRAFIIFHDCGHGSFFKSSRANKVTGFIAGLLTFTPYYHWRWQHALHHASAGNLERRGTGDIYTLTVQEYLDSTPWKRFSYRLSRSPIVLFVIAPLYLFVFSQRFATKDARPRERRSVRWMNLAILGKAAILSWIFGIGNYLLIQCIVLFVAGTSGIWLFYVQHQFEDAYWERDEVWDYASAAFKGSSFYKLPRVLQWFSGNIGYHHVHHLSPRIPNYYLERCHDSHPCFCDIEPITVLGSLHTIRLKLWDEGLGKLVSFRRAHEDQKERERAARDEPPEPEAPEGLDR